MLAMPPRLVCILYGKIREDVREIISTLYKYKDVGIIAGTVCIDHVHLSVAISPKLSISNFMGYLKGKSTLMIYDRHPELQSEWDKAFGESSNIALWRANNKPPVELVVANFWGHVPVSFHVSQQNMVE